MKRLAALMVLLALTCLPVSACLNDSETQNAELEFRSSYLSPGGSGTHGQRIAHYSAKHLLFLFPGLFLILVVWWRKRRLPNGSSGAAGPR